MTIRPGWLAIPVLAVLLFLLAAEWLLPDAAAPPLRPPPRIPAAATDTAVDSNIVQWGNAILARPLLNPDRRPVRAPELAADDTLPRLSAIIVIGGVRHAIFAGDTKPQLVTEGGEIGAYRLQTVAPDRVTLLGPDGSVTLRPQFITAPAR
jgi:hypothetical protein